jgi:hypothetical protein
MGQLTETAEAGLRAIDLDVAGQRFALWKQPYDFVARLPASPTATNGRSGC